MSYRALTLLDRARGPEEGSLTTFRDMTESKKRPNK